MELRDGEDFRKARVCYYRTHSDDIHCTGYCKACKAANHSLIKKMNIIRKAVITNG